MTKPSRAFCLNPGDVTKMNGSLYVCESVSRESVPYDLHARNISYYAVRLMKLRKLRKRSYDPTAKLKIVAEGESKFNIVGRMKPNWEWTE